VEQVSQAVPSTVFNNINTNTNFITLSYRGFKLHARIATVIHVAPDGDMYIYQNLSAVY